MRGGQDNNPAEPLEEVQLVQGHDHATPAARKGLERREDCRAARGVHCAEGVVREQHSRRCVQRARQRQPLRLAPRKRDAALAHLGANAAQAIHVSVERGRAERRVHVAAAAHGHVTLDAATEDKGALRHPTNWPPDLAAARGEAQVPQQR